MGSGVAHGLIHQIQAGWHYCHKTEHPSFFPSVTYVIVRVRSKSELIDFFFFFFFELFLLGIRVQHS